jgi:hypothetical protein
MRKFILITIVCLAGATASSVLLTSSAGMQSASTIDFSSFTTASWTANTVNLGGGVSVLGIGGDLYFSWNGWGLGANGSWTGTGRNGYVGINNPLAMKFSFDAPVAEVGGFMNYAAGYANILIEALGNSGQVLESYDIDQLAPVVTTVSNDGAFRGISRSSADIYGYRVTGGAVVVDDLKYSAIPEPATALILGLGGGLIALYRRFFGRV